MGAQLLLEEFFLHLFPLAFLQSQMFEWFKLDFSLQCALCIHASFLQVLNHLQTVYSPRMMPAERSLGSLVAIILLILLTPLVALIEMMEEEEEEEEWEETDKMI